MEQRIRILIQHLIDKGMEVASIRGFIRAATLTLLTDPGMSVHELTRHLQVLGWNDLELDAATIYLLLATFDPEVADRLIRWVDPP
jgi:hypothetical protein